MASTLPDCPSLSQLDIYSLQILLFLNNTFWGHQKKPCEFTISTIVIGIATKCHRYFTSLHLSLTRTSSTLPLMKTDNHVAYHHLPWITHTRFPLAQMLSLYESNMWATQSQNPVLKGSALELLSVPFIILIRIQTGDKWHTLLRLIWYEPDKWTA